MRVAVLAGGTSAEREVSLRSGMQVAAALRARGHHVTEIDSAGFEDWGRLVDARVDAVFVALHGRGGEDGTIQGVLELLGLPYTGCGVLASALCLDKARANFVLAATGLPVPDYVEVDARSELDPEALIARLGTPVVVKPVREGSTIGLAIARDQDQLMDGVVLAGSFDRRVLCQRFVRGVEITVGVLATPDLEVLPTLEIVSDNPLYDYDAKYTAGKSHHIIPARIPEAHALRAQEVSATAFTALGCEGMARVDIIVDEDGTPWLLEVNTVPGMTELSLLPDAALAAGISFDEFCHRQVVHAVQRGAR